MATKRKKLVRVIPLPMYWRMLGISETQGRKFRDGDPEFPRDGLVQIGLNRLGIREDRGADFQHVLEQRAQRMRPVIPTNMSDPRDFARKSVEARRKKAAARRAALLAGKATNAATR